MIERIEKVRRFLREQYVNPNCRYYHGDNHELSLHASPSEAARGSWMFITCRECKIGVGPDWFGFPKPHVEPLSDAESTRIMKAEATAMAMIDRRRDWCMSLGFNLWIASWLPLGHDDRSVYLDAWEERHGGVQ